MTSAYLTNWLYVWLFLVAGAALVVLILLFSKLINPSHLTPEKLAPYECGIPPVGNPWSPFAVRYFVFGLLFLVFDVEAVFLFPWALHVPHAGHRRASSRCVLFVAVLGFGLALRVAQGGPGVGVSEWPDRCRYPKLEHFQEPNVITTTADFIFSWARSHSVFPFTYGLACCAIEMLSSGFARFDVARYGMEVFRPTPRQCDLMIVAGTCNEKMAPVLKRLYDQMADPKWVISMGACATSGGPLLRRLQRRERRRQDRARRRLHPGLPAASRSALPGSPRAAGQDPAVLVRAAGAAGDAARES